VQIARANGATVTAVASARHEEFARSLGATDFIDYERQKFTESGRTWDVIFDAAGKNSYSESKRVLASGGTYVTTEPSLRGLFVTLATLPMKKRGKIMLARPRRQDLDELLRLHTDGRLAAHVAETFPLTAVADAHRRIEEGGFCGKLVLSVGAK
jgi:NADPH2:quinone reductase